MYNLDLTGLQDLVLVFGNLFQALLPIALIMGFVGFFALLIGSKILGKISMAHPMEMKRVTRKRKAMAVATIAIVGMLFISLAATPATAVNGTLTVGVTQVFGNTPLTVKAESLDASTAYAIYWGSTAVINWTSEATPADRVVTFEATPPASGNTVTLYLYSAGTTVASMVIYIADEEDFFPTDFFINLGITVLIFALIAVLVASVVKRRL